ncbi:MAG: hypothetical protein OIF51_08885 [Cellvibrionaceae bacterium]|nr:hypothetical protein [Cellvibrionaceae bacterium]
MAVEKEANSVFDTLVGIAKTAIQYSAEAGKNRVYLSRQLIRDFRVKKTRFSPMFRAYESEKVFLKDRELEDNLGEMRDSYASLAIDHFKLEDIIADRNLESLEDRFRELYALEKIVENATISQAYTPYLGVDNIVNEVSSQPPLVQLQLKKFFTIKAIACYVNGINLTIENCDKIILADEELRKHNLKLIVQSLIQEAFEIACNSEEERQEFIDGVYHAMTGKVVPNSPERVEPPTVAPELYKERVDRKENPIAFIRRVYGPWLGRGITRPQLKHLDMPLYQGLYRFLRDNDEPTDIQLGLPKVRGTHAFKRAADGKSEGGPRVSDEAETAQRERTVWVKRVDRMP